MRVTKNKAFKDSAHESRVNAGIFFSLSTWWTTGGSQAVNCLRHPQPVAVRHSRSFMQRVWLFSLSPCPFISLAPSWSSAGVQGFLTSNAGLDS